MSSSSKSLLSDISKGQSVLGGALSQVGMSGVKLPLRLRSQGEQWRIVSDCEVMVSLDDDRAKGIHMSRLYQLVTDFFEVNELQGSDQLKDLVESLRDSQEGLSKHAYLKLQFDWPLKRQALKSEGGGWQTYPVEILAESGPGGFEVYFRFEVLYSSTCPCSAALARQLIQEKFGQDFADSELVSIESVTNWLGEQSSIAGVPHAQRSVAKIEVGFRQPLNLWPLEELVDQVEHALKTPVQTFVKREDEQEFARLNALDLKFCEDAARTIKASLSSRGDLKTFSGEVIHIESLHAHSAVARF